MNEALYRFFDANHNLLYVGISNNWQARLKQHYKDSEFHWETAYITLEHFNTREQVEEAEKIAIANESPKYNKAFNPNFEDATKHLTKIKYWVYSNIVPDDAHAGIVNELRSLFVIDSDWQNKTAGPIAFYLLEMLPDWAEKYGVDCMECQNAWRSNQIESWSRLFREKKCL
jgi:predicted GIY-YIG superfamily endonuclease